jgi:hypothetical protein
MPIADTYVKLVVGSFGLYGLQMLFVPEKMVRSVHLKEFS